MSNNIVRLPYTAEELKTLLFKVANTDIEWTRSYLLLHDASMGIQNSTFDLSSYLPQDGCLYEVMIEVHNNDPSCNICFYSQAKNSLYFRSVSLNNRRSDWERSVGSVFTYGTLKYENYEAVPHVKIECVAYRRAGKIQTAS